MNSKISLKLRVIILISSSILFAQNNSINKKNTLNGWEKKLHIKSSNKSVTISNNELISISERISESIGYSHLKKSTNIKEISNLRSILENKNRRSIDFTNNTNGWKINWNELNNTPTNITNFENSKSLRKTNLNISTKERAISFIDENKKVFKINNPMEELVLVEEITDNLEMKHLKFSQQYKGIPIWGNEIVMHSNKDGKIYSLNARYSKTPVEIDINSVKISSNEAIGIAKEQTKKVTEIIELNTQFKKILKYNAPIAKKHIWLDSKQKEHLIWFVQIRPNLKDNFYYFIDATTGEILQNYNATVSDGPETASATDLNGVARNINVYNVSGNYYMIDGTKDMWVLDQSNIVNDPKGAVLTIDVRNKDLSNQTQLYHVTSSNNTWNDRTTVSAHYNGGVTYEYYKNVHGRNAIDDKGSTILSIVHATDKGQSMDNAYWNGAMMIYGDGNTSFTPLAGALDVAAHEMTHGVIQHTVALEYKFQSGALNESLADVFGAMVDKSNWFLGEDVTKTSYIATGVLRNMEDPHNGGTSLSDPGWQPSHMDEFLSLTIRQDNGGVHINSGIPNRACALIGNAIGKEKTEKIYYRLMNARYLNSQSQFIDMRLAAVRAATDLYGANSTEVTAVKQAFDTVGILNGSGTKPPDDLSPVEGDEWIAAINAEGNDRSLYLIKPVINNNSTDIKQLTQTQVFTGTGNPITTSDDGKFILFIDSEKYIRVIKSDGTNEKFVSEDSVWKSISLSPDGTKLAATTKWEDGYIYIFDLNNSSNSKKIKLYTPTTQEGISDTVVKFADALDWNLSSKFIIYDSFNRIPKANGTAFEYWTVNILDVANEKIYGIFPPQEEGISFGNPSFGQTNDNYLLIDKIDFNNATDTIFAINLFSGKSGLVEANGSSIGFPRYSPNDQQVVFQRTESNVSNLRKISMAENKITSSALSNDYVSGGQSPTWFTIGSRPVDLEDEQNEVLSEYHLSQNYPNPFNPTTRITYSISNIKTHNFTTVNLKVYDVLGKEIVTLVNEEKTVGNYSVLFDSGNLTSGVYYYQLRVGAYVQTKKMILLK